MEIQLENIEKTYSGIQDGRSVHAVQNISLTIPSNCIFGIIGKSGAGKSTLVRLISLLERPDSGVIRYDGARVDSLQEAGLIAQRRRIGMIFQNFNLFSSRNAARNVAYPLEICGVPRKEAEARTRELLDLVGLGDRADAPVSTLSGGQKQRVAIARALANNPDILFCDEATSALDPQTTQSILNLIRTIQQKMNLTVVMITHQMEVVRDACRYVAVVDDGAVVEQGLVEDIFMHPGTRVTRDFLSKLTMAPAVPDKSPIVRWSRSGGKFILRFNGSLTDEPVLSRLARKFDVEFNIRAGGVQCVADKEVGTLIVDLDGSESEVIHAIEYLGSQGIVVEKAEEMKENV
jgi:D-methionine transport system ATP-binding protein